MTKTLELSIVMVTWNAEKVLTSCLESVEGAVGDLSCEIIVVDNRSSDATRSLIRTHGLSGVRLVANETNEGLGTANQQGFIESVGRYVAFCNPDLVFEPGSLGRLVDHLRSDDRIGLVGPSILSGDGSLQHGPIHSTGLGAWRRRQIETTDFRTQTVRCFSVHGCCMVVSRRALEAIGGYPTTTFLYGEELLVGTRMAKAGYQVWFDGAAGVVHHVGYSVNQRWNWSERNVARRTGIIEAVRDSYSKPYFWAWSVLRIAQATLAGVLTPTEDRRLLSRRLAALHAKSLRRPLGQRK